MKTHLTSTQAELDQMKAELEAAVKRDAEQLGDGLISISEKSSADVFKSGGGIFRPAESAEIRAHIEADLQRRLEELIAAACHTQRICERPGILSSEQLVRILESVAPNTEAVGSIPFKPDETDPVEDAYFKYQEPHYRVPPPLEVWRAAWLAAEASFQEKHKYQHVCCPNCDHEFEYEPDLI